MSCSVCIINSVVAANSCCAAVSLGLVQNLAHLSLYK